LTKTEKKDPPQNKNTKPTSLGLFTFVVLLPIDVGVALIIILLYSKNHLLSNAPTVPPKSKNYTYNHSY
jgi:hypothetical protein